MFRLCTNCGTVYGDWEHSALNPRPKHLCEEMRKVLQEQQKQAAETTPHAGVADWTFHNTRS